MDSALVAGSAREWGRRAPRRGASAESLGLSHTTLTGVESWVSEATPATGSIPQAECWLSGPVPCDGSPASHLNLVENTAKPAGSEGILGLSHPEPHCRAAADCFANGIHSNGPTDSRHRKPWSVAGDSRKQ